MSENFEKGKDAIPKKETVCCFVAEPETVLAEGEGRHFPSGAGHSPELII